MAHGFSYYLGTLHEVDRSVKYASFEEASAAEKQMRKEQGENYDRHYVYHVLDEVGAQAEEYRKMTKKRKA